jgi:Ni/Fe-hydrogenase 1 B-type cytochrome subunit
MNRVSFNEPHSRGIRLWHWATLFVMSFLLLTAFAAKFLFNNFKTGKALDQQLQIQGVHLSGEQIWNTTEALKNTVWTSHSFFGYILAALLLFRIVTEIFQPGHERLFRRIGNAVQSWKQGQQVKSGRHYVLVKCAYLGAYCIIATLGGTGVWMALNRNTPLYHTEKFHAVKEIHETAVNLLLIFITMHLLGVIIAERGKYRNIVSGMIHGAREMKQGNN